MDVLASFFKFRFFALMALLLLTIGSGGVALYCQIKLDQTSPDSYYFLTFVIRWVFDSIWICYIVVYSVLITIDNRKFQPGSMGDYVTMAIWLFFALTGRTSAEDLANLANCTCVDEMLKVVLSYWSIAQPVRVVLTYMLMLGGLLVAEDDSFVQQKFEQIFNLLSSINPFRQAVIIGAPSAPEGHIAG